MLTCEINDNRNFDYEIKYDSNKRDDNSNNNKLYMIATKGMITIITAAVNKTITLIVTLPSLK